MELLEISSIQVIQMINVLVKDASTTLWNDTVMNRGKGVFPKHPASLYVAVYISKMGGLKPKP